MTCRVTIHPAANAELAALPASEQIAIDHAIEKLTVLGERLGSHTVHLFEAQVRVCENYDHALADPDGGHSIAALEANS
jgi:hypothetical protein